MSDFVFNGVSAASMGLNVERIPGIPIPRKRMTAYQIPGRTGDLHQWDGSYENITIRYQCWFKSTPVPGQARRVKAWLHQAAAGARLEDTYDSEIYRLATYAGGGEIKNIRDRFGRFTVEFDCDPRGFLRIGEMPVRIPAGAPTIVRNDTPSPAYPLLIVHGNGKAGCVVVVGGHEIDISWEWASSATIYFDCAMNEAWEMVDGVEQPVNSAIRTTIHSFPQLAPGDNLVEARGVGVDYIELVPRFWTL